VLWDTVQMPGLRREDGFDPTRIMGWLKKYRADDFVFDPARRKFVLKTGVLVADPAGATTGTFRNQATSAKRP
jgi:hypothetical protein